MLIEEYFSKKKQQKTTYFQSQRSSYESSGSRFYFSLQDEAAVLLSLNGRESLFFVQLVNSTIDLRLI